MFDKLTIGLIALALITSFGWYVTNQHLQNLKASYVGAQVQAKLDMQTLKLKKESEYNALRKEMDVQYDDLVSRYNDTLAKLRQDVKGGSTKGGAIIVSKSPGTSESSLGEGGDTFFPITLRDAHICATNTAKAQIAHEWVMSFQD